MGVTLVSGSAGFMASWIADKLIEEGHDVVGLDDLSGGFISNVGPNVRFEKLDLASWKAPGFIKQIQPEIFFHLAANAREGASQFSPADVTRRNMMAFANAIEGAIAGGKLKRVVLFSSMARYGEGEPQGPPFPETNRPAPVDVYAANKAAMEQTLRALADVHDFEYTIIIPHNVYGQKQCISDPGRNVLGIWMNSIMRQEPLIIYGDGCQTRSFSYIEDSLPCYIKCLTIESGHVINIGGERPVTINDAAEMVMDAMEPQYKRPEVIHLDDRPREVKHAFCTIEKSQKMLGFEDKTPLEDGIRKMARWAKGLGPRRWVTMELPLASEKMPKTWDPSDKLYRGGVARGNYRADRRR
jgi:UDP-glucose 4-epimerase